MGLGKTAQMCVFISHWNRERISAIRQARKNESNEENNLQQLFRFDGCIFDEGHKLKAHDAKQSKAARLIPSDYRFLLTGTPIQNNLRELWSLFNLISQGQLLGGFSSFQRDVIKPIEEGQMKNASNKQKLIGEKAAQFLRQQLDHIS
ncbi:MAG: hypothetical protein EZS28_008908 [Streblomastix strix]|uniref:Helicase ATP-binding domain-containing protein n=1 Tax=Streblomastix strix TaxID=222440 RepID=A0A5J4WL38_9EUKA|nr:MAG: hypothetical protein EZS28_008908 [Streblomastix strix]